VLITAYCDIEVDRCPSKLLSSQKVTKIQDGDVSNHLTDVFGRVGGGVYEGRG
jgi:hypothetical protein